MNYDWTTICNQVGKERLTLREDNILIFPSPISIEETFERVISHEPSDPDIIRMVKDRPITTAKKDRILEKFDQIRLRRLSE